MIEPQELSGDALAVTGWTQGLQMVSGAPTVLAAAQRFQEAHGARAGLAGHAVYHVQVLGPLLARPSPVAAALGAVGTATLVRAIDHALADRHAKRLVFEFDSLGGDLPALLELAPQIRRAGERLETVAVCNSMAAGAAYALATQCRQVIVAPGGQVGGLGVVAMHVDQSGLNERSGIAPTYVYAGQHKVEGNPHAPLGDDARAYLQAHVNEHYARLVQLVADGRRTSRGRVRAEFGQGRMVMDREAVRRGMADAVGTLGEALAGRRPGSSLTMNRHRAMIQRLEDGGPVMRLREQLDRATRDPARYSDL